MVSGEQTLLLNDDGCELPTTNRFLLGHCRFHWTTNNIFSILLLGCENFDSSNDVRDTVRLFCTPTFYSVPPTAKQVSRTLQNGSILISQILSLSVSLVFDDELFVGVGVNNIIRRHNHNHLTSITLLASLQLENTPKREEQTSNPPNKQASK